MEPLHPDLFNARVSDNENEQSPLFQKTKRGLKSRQIGLIVVSGTIGIGLFINSGEILRIAGPGGGLITFAVVGFGVAAVINSIAQLINLWPISNSMVEFVSAFVDEDLGLLVGFAYWCAYAIAFATLLGTASDLVEYWTTNQILQWLTIIAAWLIIVKINLSSVKCFGWIGSVAGGLKLAFVMGTILFMLFMNAGVFSSPAIGSKNISDGFRNDPEVTSSHIIAILISIPIATYSFCGVEIFSVCALEAIEPHKSLHFPSRYIAAILSVLYFFSILSYYLDVSWKDPLLPSGNISRSGTTDISIIMIAALNSKISILPGFMNACLIVAVLSAANTSLFVASRTLFGLTSAFHHKSQSLCCSKLSKLSETRPGSRVPVRALIASALAFAWLPFISLICGCDDRRIEEIMNGIATDAIVLVWAAQCFAFIRYKKHSANFKGWTRTAGSGRQLSESSSIENTDELLSYLQPITAWIGLIACLLIVLIFNTASWWGRGITGIQIIAAYAGPSLIGIIWLLQKTANGSKWGVEIDNYQQWEDVIVHLQSKIPDTGTKTLARNEFIPNAIISVDTSGSEIVETVTTRVRSF